MQSPRVYHAQPSLGKPDASDEAFTERAILHESIARACFL